MSAPCAGYVHVNGRLWPAARAHASVFDRGLLYGDGVFETVRAYNNRIFALPQHVARMRASARFLGIPFPRRPWQRDAATLLQRNGLRGADAWVRITLTRGVGVPGLLPRTRMRPTLIITAGRLAPAIAAARRHGARVSLLPFSRDGFLAEHKVLGYLPAVLGKVLAARRNAFEGLFVDANGYVTEGTTSNLFIRRRRLWLTPPAALILPGITRRFVIQMAAAHGLRLKERPLTPADVVAADEAFLTSSLVELVPITAVDEHKIGNGRVGPDTRHLQQLYRQMVDHSLAQP